MTAMKSKSPLWFLLLFLGNLSLSYAEPVYKAHVRVELISDVQNIVPGGACWVGLKMSMDVPWHTYWRNPGDSGMATRMEWDLPEGFEAGELHWPYPQRIDYEGGLIGYAYEGEVVLLSEIKVPTDLQEGSEQQIKGKVNWLSCAKICVPGKADLSLTLGVHTNVIRGKRFPGKAY